MKRLLTVITILLSIALSPASFCITLTGNTTPTIDAVSLNPCPEHQAYVCKTTANDIEYIPTGYNSMFISAWNTVISRTWDPTGWSLQFDNNPIDAELQVTTYQAYSNPPAPKNTHGLAGAELRINWTPTADQQDLKWIQAIHTNRPSGTTAEWSLDMLTFTVEKPPLYPYSYADHHFYDKPGRWCEADKNIFWDGYLYLARIDRTNKSVTLYDGLSWGYNIVCVPVPEPSSIALLTLGLATVAIRRKRPS